MNRTTMFISIVYGYLLHPRILLSSMVEGDEGFVQWLEMPHNTHVLNAAIATRRQELHLSHYSATDATVSLNGITTFELKSDHISYRVFFIQNIDEQGLELPEASQLVAEKIAIMHSINTAAMSNEFIQVIEENHENIRRYQKFMEPQLLEILEDALNGEVSQYFSLPMEVMPRLMAILDSEDDSVEPPERVICHGNLTAEKCYFRKVRNGLTTDRYQEELVDISEWENVHFGDVAFDLSNLIISSADPYTRRNKYMTIFRSYYYSRVDRRTTEFNLAVLKRLFRKHHREAVLLGIEPLLEVLSSDVDDEVKMAHSYRWESALEDAFSFMTHDYVSDDEQCLFAKMLRQFSRRTLLLTSAIRCLSSAAPEATSNLKIDKEALMKLRKRTGYSFVNCRKAVLQFGPDRLEEAVKWLNQQAHSEGWEKAAKLSSRPTTQGLVAVKSNGSVAVVVELNCETDFVARGDNFKDLLEKLTESALNHATKNIPKNLSDKIRAVDYDLNSLSDAEGRPFNETVAMTVGKLGENLSVRNLVALYAPEGATLFSAAHPRGESDAVNMGKYVSVVALRRPQTKGLFPTEKLAEQLCQHIIGMRSETLGEPPQPCKPSEVKAEAKDNEDDLNDFVEVQTTTVDEDETALLRQAFMLNPSQTVYEYTRDHKAEIVDFFRSELGGSE
ncbi:hypothetical protein KIN20_034164 [Parelaphostrongylus tenuis]|uniref:Elongation factor Ts, mitochondrial n=1 Tax=Parelaphostrongylus tenuis TaxID=148309 RepID=A0AAD5R9M4_PARTN|nr:hypothetical protein KIN20_034164 [Parelaphostrongylus tenuis]